MSWTDHTGQGIDTPRRERCAAGAAIANWLRADWSRAAWIGAYLSHRVGGLTIAEIAESEGVRPRAIRHRFATIRRLLSHDDDHPAPRQPSLS